MAGTDHGRVRVRLAAIDDRENPSVGIRPNLEIVLVDHGPDAEAQPFEIRLALRTPRPRWPSRWKKARFVTATRAMPSRTNPSEQLDPDSIGVADEGKFISLLLERRHFRARSLRDEFSEGVRDIGDAERQVVEFLALAVRREELALRRIPVELEPLGRTGAPKLNPHAAVAHRPLPGDFHAQHVAVEPNRAFEVAHPYSRVEVFRR